MNKYLFLQQKGSGSFSSVHTAICKKNNKKVAIKKGNQNVDLKDEYLLVCNHNHPHLMSLFDYFEHELISYMVMEYCEQDLLTFINNNTLAEDKVKDIFIQICLGVKYLHQHKIVHCDIKLDNILLSDGKIKLGDFGFASLYTLQKKKYICGSLHYLPPEVLIEIPVIGPSLDIWSLGIVLYSLLTKKFPLHLREGKHQNNLIEYLAFAIEGIKYQGSTKCVDLLSKMLELSVNKRLNIDSVLSHPWTIKLNLDRLNEKFITRINTPTETEGSPISNINLPLV